VFVRSKQGLEHKHCGSLHAADAAQALQMARDVYTRRQEGVSIWVVPSARSPPATRTTRAMLFDPAADKIYRHPTFYESQKKWGTCNERTSRLPVAPGRQRRGAGPAQCRMVRPRPHLEEDLAWPT
jgi:ring-1,2-phenylacetyl-CoA epoxidase subunit PaaB